VIIRSDSRMVRYLKQIKTSPNNRHCRWAMHMSALIDSDSTTFEFVPGHKNLVADHLSRQTYDNEDISDAEKDLLDDNLIALISDYFDNKEDFCEKHFENENVKRERTIWRSMKR